MKTDNPHARLDARSLSLHRRIAEKLREDPNLLAVAQDNLNRWDDAPAYREWRAILNKPLPEILAFLIEESETATRLRQSSPFTGILSDEERAEIFKTHASNGLV